MTTPDNAQIRERPHVGGHLSGDGPVNPSVVPTGPAPGAQHREGTALPITLVSEQLALTNRGFQLCGLGHHAYTPWTPRDPDTGLSMCWCARGCGYYVRSGEEQPTMTNSSPDTGQNRDLPGWAEEWTKGNCACGARLCKTDCYCGGHRTTCSASGVDKANCPLVVPLGVVKQ